MQFYEMDLEHFRLFYDECDIKYANEVSRLADDRFNNAAAEFSLPKKTDKYDFYLCPSVDEYIRLTGKTAETYEDWMVGWADYGLKRLCILSPRVVKDKDLDEMNRVIVHEVIHIAFDSICNADAAALWLAEGIATLCADQIDLRYVDKDNFPKIKNLLSEDDFADNGGYDYCGIYVWYFIKKYGVESFKNVYARKECADKYLSPDFEKEAIDEYIKT